MSKYLWGIAGLFLATSCALSADDLPASKQGIETLGMVNPSSRFEVEKGWNLFLTTEFLWWVAKEEGLYYVQNGYTGATTSALPPDATKNFDGHLEKVHPHFRPGFRIGLGGNMGYDEWDLFLNWTWFKSTARGSKQGALLTLWSHPEVSDELGNPQGATSAKARWHLHLNLLDLEMGRAFWVGKHCSLRPFIGARAAWIDQHFHIHYDLTTTPETDSHLSAVSNFEGGGVRTGVDTRWALLGGWSFYGLASASLLYGFYDADFHQTWESQKIANARDGFHQASSTAQLELGVRWDTYLHKDRYHIGLYAGWEQNIWFSLNKMNHFFGNLSQGNLEQMNTDLTLSGGTFGVRFDF